MIFEQIQRCLNNAVFIITEKILNEMIYDFIFLQIIDLLKSFAINQTSQSYVDISIFFVSVAEVFFKKHIQQNVVDAIVFI